MLKYIITIVIVAAAVAVALAFANELFIGLHPAVVAGVAAGFTGAVSAVIMTKKKKKDNDK